MKIKTNIFNYQFQTNFGTTTVLGEWAAGDVWLEANSELRRRITHSSCIEPCGRSSQNQLRPPAAAPPAVLTLAPERPIVGSKLSANGGRASRNVAPRPPSGSLSLVIVRPVLNGRDGRTRESSWEARFSVVWVTRGCQRSFTRDGESSRRGTLTTGRGGVNGVCEGSEREWCSTVGVTVVGVTPRRERTVQFIQSTVELMFVCH